MTAPNATILAVDDSPETLEVIERILSSAGHRVVPAGSAAEAIRVLEAMPIDLVITDMKMPKVGGMDVIRHVRENYRDTEVIAVTGYASIDGAVSAVKGGASEYVPKPFTNEELLAAVARSLARLAERRSIEQPPDPRADRFGIVGRSAPLQRVLRDIEKAAQSSATVLITGESGTGKELVARAIHYNGPRGAAPFVPINCAAVPETLIESELFGYVKGAFTGANVSRAGFFMTAEGGTLFLDEISEVSPAVQVKLLRVLQDGEVSMLGAQRPQRVDVRIIAATNKDLPVLVHQGRFREDLFYRLNVITIDVPPLRQRDDDIVVLINHFARRFAAEAERPEPEFSEDAIRVLRNYHWPGNVRELENAVERAVVLAREARVPVDVLPEHVLHSSGLRIRRDAKGYLAPDASLFEIVADFERRKIIEALESANWSQTEAAEALRIPLSTLNQKIKRLEISIPKKSELARR